MKTTTFIDFDSLTTSNSRPLSAENDLHPAIIYSRYKNAFKLIWDEGFLKKSERHTLAPVIIFSKHKGAFKLIWDEGFGIVNAISF